MPQSSKNAQKLKKKKCKISLKKKGKLMAKLSTFFQNSFVPFFLMFSVLSLKIEHKKGYGKSNISVKPV